MSKRDEKEARDLVHRITQAGADMITGREPYGMPDSPGWSKRCREKARALALEITSALSAAREQERERCAAAVREAIKEAKVGLTWPEISFVNDEVLPVIEAALRAMEATSSAEAPEDGRSPGPSPRG